ncbi:hypothetical protein BC828DRAFT_386851 [Blastocladiella britannica]|nr:hypothetical protein BC828DRAFT_386851 [Blastocladiella britannica]
MTGLARTVALITGANSGVGFGIARRLLLNHTTGTRIDACGRTLPPNTGAKSGASDDLVVVLGCRNHARATAARDALLAEFPSAKIDILDMDVSSGPSIRAAAAIARNRYGSISFLFCNAGIMPTVGLAWGAIARDMVLDTKDLWTNGTNAYVQPVGVKDSLGHGSIFVANTAGHWLLINELEPLLVSGHARVIMTSSVTAKRAYFDLDDIQGLAGNRPYHSSKYAMDVLTLHLNAKYADRGVRFFTTCPGTVYTGIISIPLPSFVMLGFYHFMRLFWKQLTVNPDTGATAAIYLASRPDEELDTRFKYFSRATRFGQSFVDRGPLVEAGLEQEAAAEAAAVDAVCNEVWQV